MILCKRPDGTVQYDGIIFEFLDYTAKALDIRKVYLHSMFELRHIYIVQHWDGLFNIYSFELVSLNLEDLKQYGYRTAQVYAINNDVIIFTI